MNYHSSLQVGVLTGMEDLMTQRLAVTFVTTDLTSSHSSFAEREWGGTSHPPGIFFLASSRVWDHSD